MIVATLFTFVLQQTHLKLITDTKSGKVNVMRPKLNDVCILSLRLFARPCWKLKTIYDFFGEDKPSQGDHMTFSTSAITVFSRL